MKTTLQAAFNEIMTRGLDGMEHVMVLSGGNDVLLERDGTEDSIFVGDWLKSGAIPEGGTFIHNHPINVSLSLSDLWIAHFSKCKIYALAVDGSEYWSHGFICDQDGMSELGPVIEMEAKRELGLAYLWAKDHPWFGFTADDADMILPHWMNKHLSAAGVMDYDFVLKGVTKDRVALADLALQRALS